VLNRRSELSRELDELAAKVERRVIDDAFGTQTAEMLCRTFQEKLAAEKAKMKAQHEAFHRRWLDIKKTITGKPHTNY
jgi:hypothetical protein